MENAFEKSIIQTLSYFSIFNTPLTATELYRRLFGFRKIDFSHFLSMLDGVKEKKIFETKSGYYFLTGEGHTIGRREESVRLIEAKMKIARRAIKKIRYVPFVEAVYVCNTVASSSTGEDSDIDVFIITSKGRIWLTRFLVTLVLSFFRMRRTKRNIANKICLSFYVTEDALDLSSVAIEQPDIYLIYWLDQLVPIYDPGGLLNHVLSSNLWLKKYLLNSFEEYDTSKRWQVKDNILSLIIKRVIGKIWGGGYGDMLESQARGAQKAKMKTNYMSVQNEDDSRVVITDKMLKFHENDKRQIYKRQWLQSCQLNYH